jgi:Zn-dependent protease
MTRATTSSNDFVQPSALPVTSCPVCRTTLNASLLVCPNCHSLVHLAELQTLSHHAQSLEPVNPMAAAAAWQQCLTYLPPDSPQAQQVHQRIQMLVHAVGHVSPGDDSLANGVAKTGISMLVSAAVYAFMFGDIKLAIGFVVLMLIHEMGHVIALKNYGLARGAPLFIPFMGAVINLRSSPKNAAQEAIVGIGGPVLGTVGALACFALAFAMPAYSATLVNIAFWGFMLNLFNMLPVPPLDGGRVTAAISPWIWMPGLLGLVGLIIAEIHNSTPSFIPFLILIYAAPRIWKTIVSGQRHAPYYQIPRKTSWLIGGAYVSLIVLLIAMTHHTMPTGFQF